MVLDTTSTSVGELLDTTSTSVGEFLDTISTSVGELLLYPSRYRLCPLALTLSVFLAADAVDQTAACIHKTV